MSTDGLKFKTYVDQQRLNKQKLADEIGTSKQNLFQLFKSKVLQPETRSKIEKALKVKWSTIDSVNIDLPKGNDVNELKKIIELSSKEINVIHEPTALHVILSLVDGNKALIDSNRVLSEANKDLAAANLKMANDHSELVQLAKITLNLSKLPLGDLVNSQARDEDLPQAANELKSTGRSGAFEIPGQNVPKGNLKAKGK